MDSAALLTVDMNASSLNVTKSRKAASRSVDYTFTGFPVTNVQVTL